MEFFGNIIGLLTLFQSYLGHSRLECDIFDSFSIRFIQNAIFDMNKLFLNEKTGVERRLFLSIKIVPITKERQRADCRTQTSPKNNPVMCGIVLNASKQKTD